MTARAISIEAYHRHIESGEALVQWQSIYGWLRMSWGCLSGKGYTRQEIAHHLDMPINVICGRVKELLDAGLIVELPRRKCTVTGHMAHPVTVAE